jgi:hypothetical protein
MPVRYTPQGCKVETTYTLRADGAFNEDVVLSVDPASQLSLAVEEHASRPVARRELPRGSSRIRATRHGFEFVPERAR